MSLTSPVRTQLQFTEKELTSDGFAKNLFRLATDSTMPDQVKPAELHSKSGLIKVTVQSVSTADRELEDIYLAFPDSAATGRMLHVRIRNYDNRPSSVDFTLHQQ